MKRGILMSAVLAASVLLGAQYAWGDDGKPLYDKSCASCHGPTGKGDGPAAKALKTKPKEFSAALAGKADADIVKTVREGVVGNEPRHPKNAKLTDEQIASLVQYVKQLK